MLILIYSVTLFNTSIQEKYYHFPFSFCHILPFLNQVRLHIKFTMCAVNLQVGRGMVSLVDIAVPNSSNDKLITRTYNIQQSSMKLTNYSTFKDIVIVL